MRQALSGLEMAILRALADGLHSKEVAVLVKRSKPTVEGYVRQLCLKFEARSRAQLVAKALTAGALEPIETSQSDGLNSAAGRNGSVA